MRQALTPNAEWENPFKPGEAARAGLEKLVYRSRAVKPLSPPELHELTRTAQSRNSREEITGLMLYDNHRFFQWLEGPADSVDRVMGSIRQDRRHTEIEVLDSRPAEARAFGDWSMKLATPEPIFDAWQRDVIAPPSDLVEDLRNRPDAAPVLLAKLVSMAASRAGQPETDLTERLPLSRKTAAILKSVFLAAVLPQLAGDKPASGSAVTLAPHPRAHELAELLLASDQHASMELIEELHGGGAIGPLYAALIEPAARRLGDLWNEDSCSEFDVTLGMLRLQTAARLLSKDVPARLPGRLPQPVVLVVPEPGELHRLGAALDGSVLHSAGWSPHCEYPTDGNALDDLLASTWFDVLDLSLSTAFRREDRLPRLTRLIADARQASRNPALVVVVGGRVFVEERAAGNSIGADHANTTALDVNKSILRTMSATGTTTLAPSETLQVTALPS